MISLWHGVEPTEAEAQIRSLNRRLSELDEALVAGQKLLARNPSSFAAKLSLSGLSQLQDRLQAERLVLVKHRKNERIAVALSGVAFEDHTAYVGQLGIFLIRLQKLFSSVAQAITVGPRSRGPISYDLTSATQMRFAEVFPSSFGMELFVPSKLDLLGDSTASLTLQTLFSLLNATNRETQVARLSAELGQRSLSHLRHVLSDLDKSNSGFSLLWTDMAGTRFEWSAQPNDVSTLRRNVNQFRERHTSERKIDGALVGASLLRNNFELMSDDGYLFEGKIARSIKPKMREFFGRWCRITLDQTDIVDSLTDETKSFYTLVDIDAAD